MKSKSLGSLVIGCFLLPFIWASCSKSSSSPTTNTNVIGNITTVAGNNDTTADTGDGGPATAAGISETIGVCMDAAGNLYISEGLHHRIRKVSPNGIITTVAGNGNYGFSGDGGAATAALLNNPEYLCTDASGKLYFADSYNDRIRTVSNSGIINTFAGSGNYFVTNYGDGGQAALAELSWPEGVCVDGSNNFYIADYLNARIRKVNANGIISTVVGNGSDGFSGDGGLATSATIWGPQGICVDASGNLFIADWLNKRVRKVSPNGIITTVAGNGSGSFMGDGGQATLAGIDPQGVATDSYGNLFIADWSNGRVRKVDANGIITTVAGGGHPSSPNVYGDGGPATSAWLPIPTSVCTDAAGNLYIASAGRIRKVTLH